jgi:hypothetical protein
VSPCQAARPFYYPVVILPPLREYSVTRDDG